MKVLIVVASRHGATTGIASALADELRHDGHTADIVNTTDAPPPMGYDAVVVGSAVYIGKWLKPAREYLERHQLELSNLPVWLFSSGPAGEAAPQAKDDPEHISELVKLVGARGHRTFQGKLDPSHLGLGERLIIWNVKRFVRDAAREGDFRDWASIAEWADEIAAALPVAAT
jgi:menaquinone-dependent protoporphyrinogen oxidase